jgi:hypothetical protein
MYERREPGLIWLVAILALLAAPHLAGASPSAAARSSLPHGEGRAARVPKGLSFTNGAGCRPRGDWPRVDARVRTVLVNAAKRYAVRVSCLHTGHSKYVRGTTRVSNHYAWRAVDIDRVNGQPVRAWNPAAKRLVLALGRGRMGAQPSEVGSPWSFGRRPWFTDSGHKKHLHVGFRSR